MNYKQKFSYTVLGAVIMLVGIGVGSIVSPPLIAQRDGAFGEIECTKLIVVDKAGKPAIRLDAVEDGNGVIVYDKVGKAAIQLSSLKPNNGVVIYDKAEKTGIVLTAGEEGNHIALSDKAEKTGIVLIAGEKGNHAVVFDEAGEIKWGTLSD